MTTIKFWILKDSVTNLYYVDAGLALGNANDAVFLRTEGSVKDGISKRKTMIRRDAKLDDKMWKDRIRFAKNRVELPNFGIETVTVCVTISN